MEARPKKCDVWKCSKGIGLVKALAIQARSNEPQAIHFLNATFFLLTTSFQLILPPFFSSCLAAFSVQYVPCTPPDILPPWGNPASTTHTQPFPSVPAEILASRTSNSSALGARIRTAAQAAFPRSAAPFLPLDFTDSRLAELKRFVRLIKLGRRYVEGLVPLWQTVRIFFYPLPNSYSTLLFNKIRCYVTARCNFH